MNIGIVVDNDFNSDIRVRKEADILQRHGYNVHVLCFAFDNKSYPSINGIHVTRIPISKRTKNILFFFFNRFPLYESLWKKEIVRFIERNDIEVLHAHDLYLSKASYSAISKSKRNVELILDLHENFPAAIQSYNWTKGLMRNYLACPSAWKRKEAEYLRYASRIIVLSDYYKQELINSYDFLQMDRVFVFPNVIDLRRFEKYKVNTDIKRSERITLFYFGAVAERRGIFDAIKAFRTVLAVNQNIELLIVGPLDKADKQRFYDSISHSSLTNNVKYIPWIDISELVTYMHISDICLSPLIKNSQHESGVANKLFQYMFGRKPIIASDCLPQKELIDNFNCGLVYATQNEFVECINKLVNSAQLREKLGNNGYNQLYANFDNENFERILLSVYDFNKS